MAAVSKYSRLYYEPTDGTLRWARVHPRSKVQPGDIAGCIDGVGYRVVRVDGRNYKVHRVVWEIHHGEIPPGLQVDHIDHNRLNNRIENLRLVTCAENNKNKSLDYRNKHGVPGVKRKSNGRWEASISVDGKYRYLGDFESVSGAIEARKRAEADCGYHHNHGN